MDSMPFTKKERYPIFLRTLKLSDRLRLVVKEGYSVAANSILIKFKH